MLLLSGFCWFMIYLCRFCTLMARVMWSILNLETLESLALTDTDSSHRSTCHTLHGQVSIVHTPEILISNVRQSGASRTKSDFLTHLPRGPTDPPAKNIYFFIDAYWCDLCVTPPPWTPKMDFTEKRGWNYTKQFNYVNFSFGTNIYTQCGS